MYGDEEILSISRADNGFVVKKALTPEERVKKEKALKGKEGMAVPSGSDPHMTVHEDAKSVLKYVSGCLDKYASAMDVYDKSFEEAAKEHKGKG